MASPDKVCRFARTRGLLHEPSAKRENMKVLDDPNVSGRAEELNALLAALIGLRKGDASVRLP